MRGLQAGAGTDGARATVSVTVDATTTLKSGGAEDWHGRATVKRRPDGVLVLIFRTAPGHATENAQLHVRFSDDDGATWTADDTTLAGDPVSGFPMNPAVGNISVGDGWLMVAPSGDLVLHMWALTGTWGSGGAAGTHQSRSTDGGETWSAPAQVDFGGLSEAQNDLTFATDDDFVWDGSIYAAARIYNDVPPTESYVVHIRSDDDGATWDYISNVTAPTSDTQEIGLEYVGNDTIVGVVRSSLNSRTLQATSTDMGATWSTVDRSADLSVSGRHHLYARAHLQGLSGWWKDPVLVMCGFRLMSPGSSHPRRNAVWTSPDRGTTWTGPHYIDVQTQDAGYGDIFWNGDGYTVVNYQGTLTAAALKQYDLTIAGI